MILLIAALALAGYFYYRSRHTPEAVKSAEIKVLSETIGQFVLVPEGEEPTIATVTDKEKLSGKEFFQKAENGDKILIYAVSGRAILYRPSIKKIVDMTTVSAQPATTSSQAASKPAETVPAVAAPVPAPNPALIRVALANGSGEFGTLDALEEKLRTAFTTVTVVAKTDAARNDYPKTLVVDIAGGRTAIASLLASTLRGEVAALPEGEVAPAGADILIITGTGE